VLQGGGVLRDTRELGAVLLRYHEREYGLLNFNQMERMVEERTIVELGEKLALLDASAEILIRLVSNKRYSHGLTVALNTLNRLIG
jgi:hypothetical protein